MGLNDIQFLEPGYLALLFIPGLMLILWLWRLAIRRAEVAQYLKKRIVPVKEKYLFFGPLVFWACLIAAISLAITALSRPAKVMAVKSDTSIDLVVIQDGSASTRVMDVKPDRWQRSVIFLRTLVETLRWRGDRFALASFAHRASPYIRLTTDPNVVMFFLDHLKKESPFSLRDKKTWDTNIEEGIYYGVKLLAKDQEFYGPSKNPRAFILISDGQAWSGKMEAIFRIVKNVAPVYVIGVGTTVGGVIPDAGPVIPTSYIDELGMEVEVPAPPLDPEESKPVHSSIDRRSLRNIASTTGGEYFELDTESDSRIALKIINKVTNSRPRVEDTRKEKVFQELYWYCLLGASIFLGLGVYAISR